MSAIKGLWRGLAESEARRLREWEQRYQPAPDPAGIYAAILGGPQLSKKPLGGLKPVCCTNCGAPLAITNAGRSAKCDYCLTSYERLVNDTKEQ